MRVKPSAVNAVNLDPGKKITISFETQETKNENDWIFATFGAATLNPTVNVYADDDLEAYAAFDYREKRSALIRKGPHVWQLEGVLLPHHEIRVRWYKKALSEKWMSV